VTRDDRGRGVHDGSSLEAPHVRVCVRDGHSHGRNVWAAEHGMSKLWAS